MSVHEWALLIGAVAATISAVARLILAVTRARHSERHRRR